MSEYDNTFEDGWFAAETGKALAECPYLDGTGYAIMWRAGWREFMRCLGLVS